MKRASALVMAGILASGLAFGGAVIQGNAENSKSASEIEITAYNEDVDNMILDDMIAFPDIEEEIKGYDFLTEDEKALIIQSEKEALPHYEEAEKIFQEIEKISEPIARKYDKATAEYDRIALETQKLWDKMFEFWSNSSYEVFDNLSNRELINRSNTITEEEKAQLLQAEDRLDELNEELNKMYDEIDAATADLQAELEKCYEKADAALSKADAVWDKIYDHIGATMPADAILY
ncbi:MAG: hypothetical protein Q4D65_08820 [Peptostreptococcaceae bacterium]|nr:hypothetical protein [Peptostreptococcaceae bacterium]